METKFDKQSYKYLLDSFGEERIVDRFNWLYDLIHNYLKSENAEDYTYLSETILQHVIVDYFVDIDRLKSFHEIETTNKTKIYAYIVFWVLRHKPIQITSKAPKDKWDINEAFAAELLRSFLQDDPSNVLILREVESDINDFQRTLIYYFPMEYHLLPLLRIFLQNCSNVKILIKFVFL